MAMSMPALLVRKRTSVCVGWSVRVELYRMSKSYVWMLFKQLFVKLIPSQDSLMSAERLDIGHHDRDILVGIIRNEGTTRLSVWRKYAAKTLSYLPSKLKNVEGR